jgi:hypothetical protein
MRDASGMLLTLVGDASVRSLATDTQDGCRRLPEGPGGGDADLVPVPCKVRNFPDLGLRAK